MTSFFTDVIQVSETSSEACQSSKQPHGQQLLNAAICSLPFTFSMWRVQNTVFECPWLAYSSTVHSCECIMTVAITIVHTSSNLFLHKGITISDTQIPFSNQRIGHILTKYVWHFSFHQKSFQPKLLNVFLYAFFMCKRVLYYCNQKSAQLQLTNISSI